MNEQEQIIFNRIAGYSPKDVSAIPGERGGPYDGTKVVVTLEDDSKLDFFFPDYAGMTDPEIAEVVANNLKEERWNSLNGS